MNMNKLHQIMFLEVTEPVLDLISCAGVRLALSHAWWIGHVCACGQAAVSKPTMPDVGFEYRQEIVVSAFGIDVRV